MRLSVTLVMLALGYSAAVAQNPSTRTPKANADSVHPSAIDTVKHKAAKAKKTKDTVQHRAAPEAEKPIVSNQPSRESNTTEARLARYTLVLAIVTALLAIETGGLVWVAWRQGQQIEREFISTHRPRLILRRLTLDFGRNSMAAPDMRVEIANTGESEASITRLAVVFIASPGGSPPAWRILEDLEKGAIADAENHILNSGDSYAIKIPPNSEVAMAFGKGTSFEIFCIGYVEYRDAFNASVRRTGFIRKTDNLYAMGKFKRVDDADFEYAD